MLVSTGAATIPEIDECVGWLRGWGVPFGLLHCVSAYPTPIADARLAWIDDLRRRFDVPVGYSDHTTEPMAGALATAAGACVIEKHLTWNRFASGPDHAASADPQQFAAYVAMTRTAARMRGRGSREVLPVEADVRRLSRQSLITARALTAGDRIRREDLIAQRPGTGILARELDAVAGRPLVRDLPAGTILHWDMLADAA
jgi:N-acetylneuraminate synthase/N,N'-diacetyllegionaminate synthase